FTNTPTATGTAVASGATSSVSVTGFADDTDYHWQYRTIDQTNRTSGWVSFGGNLESAADFRVAVPQDPNSPAGLGQFESNGTTPIPVGGTLPILDGGVIFKGTVSDPDPGSSLSLQVEVRPISAGFSNVATNSSGPVASGAQATVSFSASLLTSYHWQARVCDQTSRCSGWFSFPQPVPNPETEADFSRGALAPPPRSPAGIRP
ncbi:MAG: hypothetical protein ACREN5_07190, partial [Gemmatimonadales bacterium]